MRRTGADFSKTESSNVREFVAIAAEQAGGQSELSRRAKLAQPTVAGLISGVRGPGAKSLRQIAQACGVTSDEITSGIGTLKIRALGGTPTDRANSSSRVRASQALAALYDLPIADVFRVFDELAMALPDAVPATIWFDVGRSAIERKNAGLTLKRLK